MLLFYLNFVFLSSETWSKKGEKRQNQKLVFMCLTAVFALADQKVSALCWVAVHSYTHTHALTQTHTRATLCTMAHWCPAAPVNTVLQRVIHPHTQRQLRPDRSPAPPPNPKTHRHTHMVHRHKSRDIQELEEMGGNEEEAKRSSKKKWK